MICKRLGVVISLLALTIAATASAQDPPPRDEGIAERIGRTIDDAIKDLSERAQQQFARARSTVQAMGIEARVYARIHWDKDLNDAAIAFEVGDDGVTILRGTVASAELKQKAIDLTQDTVGVSRVVDEMTIASSDAEDDGEE